MKEERNLILGLDISTTCIGIVLFEDMGDHGEIKLLKHVSPVVKPKCTNKMEELFKKSDIFDKDFFSKFKNLGIKEVIIEEPLLRAINVNTVISLVRFNSIISKMIYDSIGIVPKYISSYDARKYAFSSLMDIRRTKKNGDPLNEKEIAKNTPVLFGAYPFDADKKAIIWDLVSDEFPQIEWFYDKNLKLKKESFDMSDAVTCVLGYMRQHNLWK